MNLWGVLLLPLLPLLPLYESAGIRFHALRTRQAGAHRFVSLHVLVPGKWTVATGHHLLEKIEKELHAAVPNVVVTTHLEALSDPASWDDETS